ncbi:unnamed protein product [Schistosoma rodhaini]|uniref:Uncharacterized protein n=1 Tax=Schistosoma rodhaini TaxID=6188 RepID=A0AA85FX04_9TREM|nr:unnamed protein product [Schistosoma rodhaini]
MNDNQLATTTTCNKVTNTTDKTTYEQNITQLKLKSSSYITNKELEQSSNSKKRVFCEGLKKSRVNEG